MMPTAISSKGGWEFPVLKVLRIVDGDTYDLYTDLGFYQFGAYRFRLRGIDTPELYRPEDDEELEAARAARDFVDDWFGVHTVKGDGVWLRVFSQGSFGRWIADVYWRDSEGVEHHLSTALEDEGFNWQE